MRAAETAEFGEVRVGDARAAKGLRKRIARLRGQARRVGQVRHVGQAVELRIVARARDGAYVDETLNAVGFEQSEKIFDGAIGMTDGEDERTGETFLVFGSAIHNESISLNEEIRETNGLPRKPTAR